MVLVYRYKYVPVVYPYASQGELEGRIFPSDGCSKRIVCIIGWQTGRKHRVVRA